VLGISPLLTERQTLAAARHTMTIAKRAAVKRDLRLGVSRAITAVVQASVVAAQTKNRKTKLDADQVIQSARELIMGIVVARAMVRKSG
jgi:flagellar biosynthesis protein FliR